MKNFSTKNLSCWYRTKHHEVTAANSTPYTGTSQHPNGLRPWVMKIMFQQHNRRQRLFHYFENASTFLFVSILFCISTIPSVSSLKVVLNEEFSSSSVSSSASSLSLWSSYRVVHKVGDSTEATLFHGGDIAFFVGGQWCRLTGNDDDDGRSSRMELVEDATKFNIRGIDKVLGPYTSHSATWICHVAQEQNDEKYPNEKSSSTSTLRRVTKQETELQAYDFDARDEKPSSILVKTTIKNFDSGNDVLFEALWPNGSWGTSPFDYNVSSWDSTMINWPVFVETENEKSDKNLPTSMFSWEGTFMNPVVGRTSKGSVGGPTVFYNDHDPTFQTVVVGSVWDGNWKSFSSGDGIDCKGDSVLWNPGTSGRIQKLPSGYQQSVLLHTTSSGGITNTIHDWGQTLQQSRDLYKDEKKKFVEQDVTLTKIGYQTDNGAMYCFCQDQNCSKTIIDEIQYLKDSGTPMGYLSFQGSGASSGRGSAAPWCVNTWGIDGGLSSKYPVPVKDMQKVIGIPLQLYIPYFCPESSYFENNDSSGNDGEGGKWQSLVSDTSLPGCSRFPFQDVRPDQSFAFYKDLFQRGIDAGMVSFESDFMNQNYNCVPDFVRTTSAASTWQSGMANAAKYHNIAIQWCMATPSDAMASLDYPAVTNFRVSTDFCYGESWNIGISSLLIWALGAAPSKDTLWSTNNNKTAIPGCPWTPDHETPAAELHLVLALMSTGPVGLSDSIGMTNTTLLKRTITADGTLLKPLKPITAIDSSFLSNDVSGLDGYVYSTTSLFSWHFVSFKMKTPYPINLGDFWPPLYPPQDKNNKKKDQGTETMPTRPPAVIAYRHFHMNSDCHNGTDAVSSGCVQLVTLKDSTSPSSSTTIFSTPVSSFDDVEGGSDFAPEITTVWKSPCTSNGDGWILLGDLTKYVPLSNTRFPMIQCISSSSGNESDGGGGLKMEVIGSVGEVIVVTALRPYPSQFLGETQKQPVLQTASMIVVNKRVTIPKSGHYILEFGDIDNKDGQRLQQQQQQQ